MLPGFIVVMLATAFWCPWARGEIYIYRGTDGERLVSDHPIDGYRLVSRRDTLRHAGDILANRPIPTVGPDDLKHYIAAVSDKYGLDPALLQAVIEVESGFDPNAVSRKGATGLMQLMEPTARQYRVRDRFDPIANIDAGARHLRSLMDRFNGELRLVLAAYNAGATPVEKYRDVPPFPETQQFVSKVLAFLLQYRSTSD